MVGLSNLEIPFLAFCQIRSGYEILQVERYVVMSLKSFFSQKSPISDWERTEDQRKRDFTL